MLVQGDLLVVMKCTSVPNSDVASMYYYFLICFSMHTKWHPNGTVRIKSTFLVFISFFFFTVYVRSTDLSSWHFLAKCLMSSLLFSSTHLFKLSVLRIQLVLACNCAIVWAPKKSRHPTPGACKHFLGLHKLCYSWCCPAMTVLCRPLVGFHILEAVPYLLRSVHCFWSKRRCCC